MNNETNPLRLKPEYQKSIKAYTRPDVPEYFWQVKQACDFVNSREDVFKGNYGPAVQLLIDYIQALENENKEYKGKLNSIKELIEEE